MQPDVELFGRIRDYFSIRLGKDEEGRIFQLPVPIRCINQLMDGEGHICFEKGERYQLDSVNDANFQFIADGIGVEYYFRDAKEVREHFIFEKRENQDDFDY